MKSEWNDYPTDRILKIRDVIELTKLSRTQVYRLIARDEFPRQIKLTSGGKISGWHLSAVSAWIDEPVSAGSQTAPKRAGK